METTPALVFNSPKDHYHADACIIWCFDDRFSPVLETFKREQRLLHVDLVKLAGGAKALASDGGPERDFLVNQIRLSMKLHHAERIILMLHMDCGGYGGSAMFADHDEEFEHHKKELRKAMEYLKDAFNDPHLEAYIADFDGLYRVL